MYQRMMTVLFLTSAMSISCLPARGDDEKSDKAAARSLNDLSMEVNALHVIHQLQLTGPQIEGLKKIARETAERSGERKEAKGSEKLRAVMTELREALAKNGDEEKIIKLLETYNELFDSEKPELDDAWELTESAVRLAPRLLRTLTPKQVAAFAGVLANDLADPREVIVEALTQARGLDADKWKEYRASISEVVGHLLAGLDGDKAVEYGDKVVQLLIIARGLNENEFKEQKPELEKKARAIVGDVGPIEVLRNVMEHDLAELLSNPVLPIALDALGKEAAKGK